MAKIDHYLQEALKRRASDLHFVSGDPARVRVHGDLHILMNDKLTTDFVQECLYEIMDVTAQRTFETRESADFAYNIENVSRFRVNVFRHLNGIGAVLRAIPATALTLEQLGLADKRGPASQAQGLYEESEESRARRERQRDLRRMAPPLGHDLQGRPSKRDRRRLEAQRAGSRRRGGGSTGA